MCKIIEFRRPAAKPLTVEQVRNQVIPHQQAMDLIITAMVCHVMPVWVERRWPFRILELITAELRDSLVDQVPESTTRHQVDQVIEELKPLWHDIAVQAIETL